MKTNWLDFLTKQIPFGGNLGLTLALTLFIFLVAFLLKRPLAFIIRKVLHIIGRKNPFLQKYIISQVEKPLEMMSMALLYLIILHFMPPLWKSLGGIPLFLSKPLIGGLNILVKLTIGSGLVWISYNLVDEGLSLFLNRFFKEQGPYFKNHFFPFINRFVKIIVLCFGSLLVLQSLGINVVSLMAGLGLGGVALALAAKDSAGNILAYINLMLDRPFSVGDWICFKDMEGTVMEVGLRSSKIKTFYDSVVTVPNSALTSAHIDNMGKRKARRTRVYLGLTYNTSPAKIEGFIKGVKEVLKNNPVVKQDYFQVYFSELGESELKIIMNFFLLVNSWEEELKEKQNIFMAVLKLAEEQGVQFAFPSRSLYIENNKKQGEKP